MQTLHHKTNLWLLLSHSKDYLTLLIEAYRLLTDDDKASLEKEGEREIKYQ